MAGLWHIPCSGQAQGMINNRFTPANNIFLSDRADFRAVRPFFFLDS